MPLGKEGIRIQHSEQHIDKTEHRMNNSQFPTPSRRRARLAAKYLEAAVASAFIGVSVVAMCFNAGEATAAPLPLTPVGGTGSADFPALPLSQSAYTGSAGSSGGTSQADLPVSIADSGSSGSGDSGSGLGSAGSDGNIDAGTPSTLSSGAVGDGSSESGNRSTPGSQNATQPLSPGTKLDVGTPDASN